MGRLTHDLHALSWGIELHRLVGPDVATDFWRTARYSSGRYPVTQAGSGRDRHPVTIRTRVALLPPRLVKNASRAASSDSAPTASNDSNRPWAAAPARAWPTPCRAGSTGPSRTARSGSPRSRAARTSPTPTSGASSPTSSTAPSRRSRPATPTSPRTHRGCATRSSAGPHSTAPPPDAGYKTKPPAKPPTNYSPPRSSTSSAPSAPHPPQTGLPGRAADTSDFEVRRRGSITDSPHHEDRSPFEATTDALHLLLARTVLWGYRTRKELLSDRARPIPRGRAGGNQAPARAAPARRRVPRA